MTYWFLAFLAAVWIAFFVPGAMRARRQTPLPAVMRFKKALNYIAPPKASPRHSTRRPAPPARKPRQDSGRWVVVPHGSERLQQREAARAIRRRRRRITGLLVAVVLLTAAAAVRWRGNWIELQLIADGALIFYLALLAETKRRSVERSTKVRALVPERAPQPARMPEARVGGGRS